MAKDLQNTSSATTKPLSKGMIKDFDETYTPEGSWIHARNAVNNTIEGDLGTIGNEPSNVFCTAAPYTIIGRTYLLSRYWVIFSTDDTNSEIGLFDETNCVYKKIVNDPCLNFNKLNLINGVAKENFDCSWSVYFGDNRNSDRFLNIGNPENWNTEQEFWEGVPWVQECEVVNDCTICTNTNQLDCDKILLSPLLNIPCIKVTKGLNGGNLYNGSYFATLRYSINGQGFGDFVTPSNIQTLFDHDNASGSLNITISNLDTENFDEFELVVVSVVNQQTVAKRIGIYNTSTTNITLDFINNELVTIPLEFIPIQTPIYDKSRLITRVNEYLLRIGPTGKYDFNYQPLANQINTKWVISRYPQDYYREGGRVVGYMRDEVYSFFIRWVYATGDKSSSYHIPGRVAINNELAPDVIGGSYVETFNDPLDIPRVFETTNTATATPAAGTTDDGGFIIANGNMGYWESTETYPADKPEIWNATADPVFSGTADTNYDLCGKPIRHHKMPEDIINGSLNYTRVATDECSAVFINVVGVQFDNIKPPVYYDENGNIKVVPNVVGYEILRGSRDGNKSIVAKGIINNMRTYDVPNDPAIGLYQNYPYNPTGTDFSLSQTEVQGGGGNYTPVTNNVRRDVFSFHSPDTSFARPFLSPKELKLYTQLGCVNNVSGNFEDVPFHPKHKLITDLAFLTSLAIGIAEAVIVANGAKTRTVEGARVLNIGLSGNIPGPIAAPNITGPVTAAQAAISGANALSTPAFAASVADFLEMISDTQTGLLITNTNQSGVGNSSRGILGSAQSYQQQLGTLDYLPLGSQAFFGIPTYFTYATQGTETALELVRSTIPYRQYALRYISHGYLHKDNVGAITSSNKRRAIRDSAYLSNTMQDFNNFKVNNLFRPKAAVVHLSSNLNNPSTNDTTLQTVGTAINQGLLPNFKEYDRRFNTTASCYYAGLKLRYRNQYGQLDSIKQIPTGCTIIVNNNNPITQEDYLNSITYSTPVIFGGDTYIGRYTEKNTFFYFYDWLLDQPDGTELDYRLRYNALYPRYWADLTKYDMSEFMGNISGAIFNPSNWDNILPSGDKSNLDGVPFGFGGWLNGNTSGGSISFRFGKKDSYFYLFQSAVRDFFVESEINVDLRDWGETDDKMFYNPTQYTNLQGLFNPRFIKLAEYFKYDISLGVSKLFTNMISWGTMQDRNYNPVIASTCYQTRPNMVIYSLPNNLESKRDFWRVFLVNNYKIFKSKVNNILPIAFNGALVLFDNDNPAQSQGVDRLETELGVKLTIGDGGLFSQPLQNISNADMSYEYGSCQNILSAINTPVGIYWMSQRQGKIFSIGKGIDEISSNGMKWWFSMFLPYTILEDFPDFELLDNPIVGVGCQSIYDNDQQLLYFCKKDYKLRSDITANVTYVTGIDFLVNDQFKIKLGDPDYFVDTSWTVSFDPKSKSWISFHDWHPDLLLSSTRAFVSTKDSGLWRHNNTTNSFCNYYGVNYPWEIDFTAQTGQQVNTLRSLEYMLECYIYDPEGVDKFHVLDYNFDQLIIYNTEQTSGVLNLVLQPKNNPFLELQYPQINPTSINVLYSKEEQKYRINQFWDITRDRGEFTNFQQPMWLTELNGYERQLNPVYLNYNKFPTERKPFRHYMVNTFFKKNVSNNVKMLMKIANNKNLNSPR